jgi:hypothetical protein
MISSANVCIPFISFSCLTTLAKKSSTLLYKSGENGHYCLIPLSDIVFIMLGNILSIPSFFRVFIVKEFEFCQRPSAYLDHVIFILDSTYVMRYAY